jgi:hypothetical protein
MTLSTVYELFTTENGKIKTTCSVLLSSTLSEAKFKDPDWGIKSTLA